MTLVFIDIAREIATSLGVDATEEVALRVAVPFGPRGASGGRAHLPKTIEP